jgi:hypothetical protein
MIDPIEHLDSYYEVCRQAQPPAPKALSRARRGWFQVPVAGFAAGVALLLALSSVASQPDAKASGEMARAVGSIQVAGYSPSPSLRSLLSWRRWFA